MFWLLVEGPLSRPGERLPALLGEPGQTGMWADLLSFGDGDCPWEVVWMAGDSSTAPGRRTAGGRDGFSAPHAQPRSGELQKTRSNILTTKMAPFCSIYLGTQ